jgi:hypothetical protein
MVHGTRRFVTWLQAGAALLAVPACAGPAAPIPGHAFQRLYATNIGAKPIRPGMELGMLYVFLGNTSRSTLVLRGIRITGSGIGTVVKEVKIAIAPLRFGYHHIEAHSTPGSLYDEDPPVDYGKGRCQWQALFGVRGYQMTPGSQARIWIVIRALRPGRWTIPAHTVLYTINGRLYQQKIPLRAVGAVKAAAPYIPVDWSEQKCIKPTGAQLLSGYHLGN